MSEIWINVYEVFGLRLQRRFMSRAEAAADPGLSCGIVFLPVYRLRVRVRPKYEAMGA